MRIKHIPVLLDHSIDQLITDPNGIYVDCTFGRGGHSKKILERLSNKGKLIAISFPLFDNLSRIFFECPPLPKVQST